MTEPSDVISFKNDKRAGDMPRELHRRRSDAAPKPPALWTSPPTLQPEALWGQYPMAMMRLGCNAAEDATWPGPEARHHAVNQSARPIVCSLIMRV